MCPWLPAWLPGVAERPLPESGKGPLTWRARRDAPELQEHPDGTLRLLDDPTVQPRDWIYVFDIDEEPRPGQSAPIHTSLIIGTDAESLSRAVFAIAPAKALAHAGNNDTVTAAITHSIRRYVPEISKDRRQKSTQFSAAVRTL
jgi:hypothetical protein